MEALIKELITEVHALREDNKLMVQSIHSLDVKAERSLVVAVQTSGQINLMKRDINRIPETCPGRARLDEHLKTHDTAARGKLNGWQKTAIAGALVTGLGTLIFNLAQAIFINTGINP